jgi:flagellar protein FliL
MIWLLFGISPRRIILHNYAHQKRSLVIMSETAEDIDEIEETKKKPKGKRQLIIILFAIILILASGGGTWYYMQAQIEKVPEEPIEPHMMATVFHELEIFTVNLMPEENGQYLQVGLTVKITEAPEIAVEITKQMPAIRNRILMLLSSKVAADISSIIGKQQLSTEITNEIRQSLDSEELKAHVLEVLFTSFVIQ